MGLENVLVAAVTNRFTSRRSFFIQAIANLLSQDPKQNLKPVPDSNEQQKAETQLRTEFSKLYKSKDPKDKNALIQSLMNKSIDSRDDPKVRYVALREARDEALKTFNVPKAWEAVTFMGDNFDVKPFELKAAILSKADKNQAPEVKDMVAEYSLKMANEAVFVNEFKIARSAATDAEKYAKVAKNTFIEQKAKEFGKVFIPEIEKLTDLAKKAEERLKENEDNVQADAKYGINSTQASTAYGKHLMLARNDFITGPRYAREGSDNDLKKLGEAELSNPNEAALEYKLGESWNSWAEINKSLFEKAKGKERALYWFDAVLQDLKGLSDEQRSKLERTVIDLKLREMDMPLSPSQLDVLKFVDLAKDKTKGTWKYEGTALTSPVGYIQPGYHTPEEYDISMLVQLKGKPELMYVGLPVADGKQVGIYFDPRGDNSKLILADGAQFEGDSKYLGDLLKNGRPCKINVSVRRNRILATADDRTLIDWSADYKQAMNAALQGAPDPKSFLFGGSTQYVFHKIIITEKSGPGKKLH